MRERVIASIIFSGYYYTLCVDLFAAFLCISNVNVQILAKQTDASTQPIIVVQFSDNELKNDVIKINISFAFYHVIAVIAHNNANGFI